MVTIKMINLYKKLNCRENHTILVRKSLLHNYAKYT